MNHLCAHCGLRMAAVALIACFAARSLAADGPPARIVSLRIGATGTMTGVADGPKEKAGNELLQRFIKDETGFDSDIGGQVKWDELTDKLTKGQFHIGVFQGYEFAWVAEKHPQIKPLAVGVNAYHYPVALIVTSKKSAVKDFADLRGKMLAIPASCHAFLRLYVDRQCEAAGRKAEGYFASIAAPENIEDCLDDVVDGKLQAAAIDQAALDAFKRRKPGRFNQLKEIARSQPFPPIVVAYCGNALDDATLRRFRESLLGAARKEKGELLLTLSRLTAFEAIPSDFEKVLAETRKAYPTAEKKEK